MRVRKTVWIFSMAILFAALVLIVNSRIQLSHEVIIGGADSVFVRSDELKNPLDDYSSLEGGKKISGLDYPDINVSDWQYILINSDNPSSTYEPDLLAINESDMYFAKYAMANLKSLLSAAREAGFTPYINCAYRSYSAQQFAFTNKANQLSRDGTYSYNEAVELARTIIAYPGTSDHQTGLGVDIVDDQYIELDYSKMDPAFFKWMDENCAQYGFIKRYPSNKEDITGWDEPWHYRYVGIDAATFIMEHNLCLEEFIDYYD